MEQQGDLMTRVKRLQACEQLHFFAARRWKAINLLSWNTEDG